MVSKIFLRLKKNMDKYDCVNIFLSEGAGINNIIKDKENKGQKIKLDAFGHVRLDEINPGKWYAAYFKNKLNCDKVLVQKSGYFSRSAAPNKEDLKLIFLHADFAVNTAIEKQSGVVGILDKDDKLTCISFSDIKGHKPFDFNVEWYQKLKKDINQT